MVVSLEKGRAGHLPVSSENRATRAATAGVIAWFSILAGALSGMVMGLWSFDGPIPTPEWIGAYDSLSRRFLRLAHIAMFALGILHFLVARQIAAAPVRPDLDRLALGSMALGNIAMPAVLIAAALWQPFKYLTPVPTLAITVAIVVAAYSSVLQYRRGSE